jgi:type I restriction enzyme, S subunit
MTSEWVHFTLDEVFDFRSGLSKPRSAFGRGYPFLTFKDVFYNTFVPKELSDLVESTESERSNGDIKRGDVFLTRTSETQRTSSA